MSEALCGTGKRTGEANCEQSILISLLGVASEAFQF